MSHLVSFLVPSSEGPGLAHVIRQIVPDGQVTAVRLPSEYLVSPGQTHDFAVAVSALPPREPKPALLDGRGVAPIEVSRSWDLSYLPSTRTLSDVLEEVVQHGVDYPTHGADCVCMDKFMRELRMHVSKAIPPDTRLAEERACQADIHARIEAKARIAVILRSLGRWL